ncbi:putative ribonuclease H-like domain-containing protein [Tanacetum coccineum]
MVKKKKEELQIKKMTRMCKILELNWIICLFNRRKVMLTTVTEIVLLVHLLVLLGNFFTNADDLPTDPLMPDLEDTADLLNTGIFSGAYDDEDVGAKADLNNLETTMNVNPIPTTRIHKDHPKDQIIGDINSATQTRRMTKISKEHAMVSYIKKQRRTNHKDYQNCLVACFLSQIEPKKVTQALTDPRWIEAILDELLQFKLQKVWRLVDLPKGKHAFGTKWVYRNKKDKRGIVVKTRQDWLHKMDVKSAFLYGNIQEEVYVCQPPDFEDPQFPDKVYKVEKSLYGLNQAPRAWYETLSTYLLKNRFRRGTINKTLFIKKDKGDILLVQVSDEAIHKELGDRMERAATTASSLDAEQDSSGPRIRVDTARHILILLGKVNMARLKKPEGSVGFHQIVDFLNSTHIKYAFTEYPTIYVSLIHQFWQTASASTSENGEMEITATIDGRVKSVTKASIRRHLKLEDSDGISTLPNTEIFERLALMGSPPHTNVADEATFTGMDVRHGGATTTITSLDAG